jgi:hypothetical protein
MFWLLNVYSPHWPLSGSVAQDIHPSLLAQAGDRGVEREVLSDVASYGKQLGKISQLLVNVAKSLPSGALDPQAQAQVDELDKMVQRIAAIKTRYKKLNPPSPPMPSPPAPTSSSRRR